MMNPFRQTSPVASGTLRQEELATAHLPETWRVKDEGCFREMLHGLHVVLLGAILWTMRVE